MSITGYTILLQGNMASKRPYTNEQMAQALRDVEKGIPVGTAAKIHGVPRVTLLYKFTGRSPKICTMGPSSILTSDEETVLVKWILELAKRHFPVSKQHLLDSVENIMKETKRENPFKNNRPGNKWFKSFLRRHPETTCFSEFNPGS